MTLQEPEDELTAIDGTAAVAALLAVIPVSSNSDINIAEVVSELREDRF